MATRTFQERLSSASAAITHGTIALVRAMVPIVLFFFVAFFLIFLIFKLFAAPYSVEFSAFSKAAIAALIVGRIALVLDWAQGSRLAKQRRAVVIALLDLRLCTGGRCILDWREDLSGRSRGGQSSRRDQP